MLLNLIIKGNNSSFRLDIIHNFLLTQKDTDFTIMLAQSLKITHASQLQQVRDHETNKVIIKLLIRLWQQNISFTEEQHSHLKSLERQERTSLTPKNSSLDILQVFIKIFGSSSVRRIYMHVHLCTCKYPCSCTGKVEYRHLSAFFLEYRVIEII